MPKINNKKTPASFRFRLDMCGVVSESDGATPIEAFGKLKAPKKIINKGVLQISHGDKTKEIFLTVPRLKRLFYPNFRGQILKGIMLGL